MEKKIEEALLKIAQGKERDVYCLKQYYGEDDEGKDLFISWWVDVNTITGFRIPLLKDDTECTKTVNIDLNGVHAPLTIKREPKIIEYLTKNFVDKCK